VISQLKAFHEFHCQALDLICRGIRQRLNPGTYAQGRQLAHAVFQHKGSPTRDQMAEDNRCVQHSGGMTREKNVMMEFVARNLGKLVSCLTPPLCGEAHVL
jgi:hypothetical protein